MQEEYNKCLKENNASMFGGCLPSLLLPILFALYAVFNSISPDSIPKCIIFMDTKCIWEGSLLYITSTSLFKYLYTKSIIDKSNSKE